MLRRLLARRLALRLRRLAWSDVETRRRFQQQGFDVLPVSFYSNSPSIEDIETSFEYAGGATPPYLDPRIFPAARLQAELAELAGFAAEFDPPRLAREAPRGSFYWENGQFSHSDAMAYYCMVRRYRPRTIVEVGGGFSTLAALAAVRRNGSGRIVCVDPFPSPVIAGLEVELVREKAQSLPVELFRSRLGDGDFLVIDSTHTVKTGSDCLHLYLRVIPQLERDVLVHAHDVFLPFGMPQRWLLEKQIFWTEQYLLLALLIDNPRASVLYGSAYHQHANPVALARLMDGKSPPGGGSLWFRYRPTTAGAPRPPWPVGAGATGGRWE